MISKFIGRKNELQKLADLTLLNRPKLIVVKGRRRIGKSRLIKEFAKSKKFLEFAGIAPSLTGNLNVQDQKLSFITRLSFILEREFEYFDDWSLIFSNITKSLGNEETVILLDEISWMGAGDQTFIAKLKNWWDLELQQFPNLTLVLCGSVSTWIEKNIINNTAFYGRISLSLDLTPLTISESSDFLRNVGYKGSNYDIYEILAVTGGIPWYLEQILPNHTSEENIKRLCFDRDGLLVNEFNVICHDLFGHKGTIYKAILELLKTGMKTLAEVREGLSYSRSGTLSDHLKHLIISGFVTQHSQHSIGTGNIKKQSLYRLSDPYICFYLYYINPVIDKIKKGFYEDISLNQTLGFDSIMGYQIERLLLQNRSLLIDTIGLNKANCLFDNPYFQKANSTQAGVQIDYLVQTRNQNLYICEMKFKKSKLGVEIINEIKEKIEKLKVPKRYAPIPILFHFGGITEPVITSNFFYRIIDINNFVETEL